MTEFFIFIGILIACLLVYGAYLAKWDFSKVGEGAKASIIKAVIVVAVLFLVIDYSYAEEPKHNVSYFQYTELFAGVDYTKKLSPNCDEGSLEEHLTSNIGIRQHFMSYKGVDVLGQYTHHSCAIGEDNKQYDALGVHVVYRWGKK